MDDVQLHPNLQQSLSQLVKLLAEFESDLHQRGSRPSALSFLFPTEQRLVTCIEIAQQQCGQEDEEVLQAIAGQIDQLSAVAEELIVKQRKRPGLVGLAMLRAAKLLLVAISQK